jgi:hypothetical protein
MRRGLAIFLAVTFAVVTVVLFAVHVSKVSAQASGGTFLGAEKCKGCHPSQYKDFESRKFTKAWNVLQMRGKTKDPECLKCHVTGFGQPGGFVSEEATPALKYKQCEACHGPGSIHAANPSDKAAMEGMKSYVSTKNVCIECHRCMKTHKEADF